MVRGNDRQDMFATDGDRLMFRRLLLEASVAHKVAVHGYTFMPNHVHLLVTGAFAGDVSRMVQHVGRKYVPVVNLQWGRCGSLWQSRYLSHLVESDVYALNVLRYIDENPVRAGIVAHAHDYPWSSHRCNAWGQEDDLITPHEAYLALGPTPHARQAAFLARSRNAMESAEVERIRAAIRSGAPLVSDDFLEAMVADHGERVLRRRTGRRAKMSVQNRLLLESFRASLDWRDRKT